MAIARVLLLLLLGCFNHLLSSAQDQDPPGFINLDCGLPLEDESYIEKDTNLTYISDANFTSFGESRSVTEEYKAWVPRPYWFLRSFPNGNKNCYELKLKEKGHYLIRANFFYGNYDDLNRQPEFDLYLGTSYWQTLKRTESVDPFQLSVLHVLRTDRLHVCLVRTGDTVPFISGLEIRPLASEIYKTRTESLHSGFPCYVGDEGAKVARYPTDTLDRRWVPHFPVGCKRLPTSEIINTTLDPYEIPQALIQTAATPVDPEASLNISLPFLPNLYLYVYMHFAETVKLRPNESREFQITFNGNLWKKSVRPQYLTLTTVYNTKALSSPDGKCEFMLTKTANSTEPPIINAFQVLYAEDLLNFETHVDDVDAMNRIKSAYRLNRVTWRGDPCAPKNYSWEGLNCSKPESGFLRITSLNLSGSQLAGEIKPMVSNLSRLTVLDLSNNYLTGALPQFLDQLRFLTVLNISGNQIKGSVPAALLRRRDNGSLTISGEGNPGLCELGSCKTDNNKRKTVAIAASVSSFCLVMTVLVIFLVYKKKRGQIFKATNPPPKEEQHLSYSDIIKFTNNFERVIGRGAFGEVYHGYMDDRQVAIKVLFKSSTTHSYKQFRAEVEILLKIHHRHLLSLVGFCEEGDKLVLVYEFMPNGDLKNHLSGGVGTTFLGWKDRLRIAAETAQGLQYLHKGCKPTVVHRDVKPTNILLDENFTAKLADFGLSRSFSTLGESHISTDIAGTMGFLDPEYYRSKHLTEKNDVYSFGVALLQIITNRPVVNDNEESPHLLDWVKFMLTEGDIGKVIDPKLRGAFELNSAWKAVELSMECVQHPSTKRPSMTQVMMELEACVTEADMHHVGARCGLDQSINIGPPLVLSGSEMIPKPR